MPPCCSASAKKVRLHARQRLLRTRGMERQQRAVRGTPPPYTTGVIGGGEVLFGGEISLANGGPTPPHGSSAPTAKASTKSQPASTATFAECTATGLLNHGIAPKPRPVILNTWEAVYFNHDYDTLTALADKAVESGVERFVVDDGWFGSRRDDTSGLGDWQISGTCGPTATSPSRRSPTTCTARDSNSACGSEPEMVNPDSDLFRAIRTGC